MTGRPRQPPRLAPERAPTACEGPRPTRNKYHAQRCACGDHWHASLAERSRCWVLQQWEKAGSIGDLQQQPRFSLRVKGHLVCTYVGDFGYSCCPADGRPGAYVVEDVKSPATRTAVYKLKAKLLLAIWDITITEVE